ncbi:hypothetical protein SDRG_08481 [Saprolegnia diclina VS20]|uniref:Transmembrane protein n=1 Tax=Saprolegnia diclina (strain VS20) TaxID=1156394 RepID=T0RN69_SAPDV|nr:hypothetical protein SDRG_08481 [Saprolegnia diclina VS20]EQC33798.1 hypothetical protein SDRG_08481 [Saprolegnia diclina VS20]|eukprot:XP_008612593.1 hypothetical protein SDRG_08481 [Saprolegnia diclina VS20]
MGKVGCLTCCAGFSVVGMVFLTIMAILLSAQPEYIRGYHHAKAPTAKNSCMYAAVLYGLTFAGSYYLLRKHHEEAALRYGVVTTDDELERLKLDADDDNDLREIKPSSSVLGAIKSQIMNAKVMHSDEMVSFVKGEGSPRGGKRPKPRKAE